MLSIQNFNNTQKAHLGHLGHFEHYQILCFIKITALHNCEQLLVLKYYRYQVQNLSR